MSKDGITKELESVKLNKYWIGRVRENKKLTRVPIAAFIEEAIKEKLERIELLNKSVVVQGNINLHPNQFKDVGE